MVSREPTGIAAAAYPASVGASSDSPSSSTLANHRTSSLLREPIITHVSASVTACPGPIGARLAWLLRAGERGAADLDRQARPG